MGDFEANVTRHMDLRMNQRGIPGALVDLVLSHGHWDGDACKLDRKDLCKLKAEVEMLRSTVLKALDKGGLAVVEAGGALVTAYARPKSRSNRK
ncbi:hypothetical protein LWE61_08115 [Sphingobium sufflavum]|uniref:hypothetical protein n=1 Tax=Sphingobium sufflavum TaxID=1129547 RepID=UPI001F2DCF6B|nr:hypothetical protein [Sphingobium sufflavum]MCE7796526.1 hypothetical protein [Sphingobium sufflavum]